jgi:hypothetical protein
VEGGKIGDLFSKIGLQEFGEGYFLLSGKIQQFGLT